MPASTSDINPGPAVSTTANTQAIYAAPGSGTSSGGTGTGLSLAVTVTAASTNNYDPGSGFPTGIGRLNVTTTLDATLTGLLAGTDGQQLIVQNVGGTYTLTLSEADASSASANQFYGQGTGAIPPGGQLYMVYNTSPSPRWSIG